MKYTMNLSVLLPLKTILITFGIVAIIGCWAPPPMIEEPLQRYWEVEAPLELTWETSIKALVEKGVSISIINKDNNLVVVEETFDGGGFKRITAERGYFYGGVARVTLLFSEKEKGKTGIHINTSLQGFTGRFYVYVTSNGNLEKDYYLLIANNLPSKKSYKWLDEDTEKGDGEDKEAGEKGTESKNTSQ